MRHGLDRAIDRLASGLPPDKPSPCGEHAPIYALGGRALRLEPLRWKIICRQPTCRWMGRIGDLVPIEDEDGMFVGCPSCRTDEFLQILRPRRTP